MAEEKEYNWTNVIVAIILFVLSSSTMGAMKYIKRIPMGPIIGSVASTASFSVGLVLMENGLNLDLLPF